MSETTPLSILPARSAIAHLTRSVDIEDAVWNSLLRPLESFLARPGKNIRGKLVMLAGRLAQPEGSVFSAAQTRALDVATRVIEALHAGSIIIDDIEDGSTVRRDGPAFHLKHGLPVALNAGNWLYFWALHELRSLQLSAEQEREIVRACHEILLEAHFGQALDVGVRIDEVEQDKVFGTCTAAIELKSGALVALAMRLGGVAAGASLEVVQKLADIGRNLGTALQFFEDIGNFSIAAPAGFSYVAAKKHEDLYLRRPSWVWAIAARHHGPDDYRRFVDAVRYLPDQSYLRAWVGLHEFERTARGEATSYLNAIRAELADRFGATHPGTVAEIGSVMDTLEKVYG